jgi:NADH dehydrogenase FAD-containing subunit
VILAGDIGATALRAKLLKAFEIVEIEVDPARQRDRLTFALVGAGRTGVEMAGAVAKVGCTPRERPGHQASRVKSTCRHLSIIR